MSHAQASRACSFEHQRGGSETTHVTGNEIGDLAGARLARLDLGDSNDALAHQGDIAHRPGCRATQVIDVACHHRVADREESGVQVGLAARFKELGDGIAIAGNKTPYERRSSIREEHVVLSSGFQDFRELGRHTGSLIVMAQRYVSAGRGERAQGPQAQDERPCHCAGRDPAAPD